MILDRGRRKAVAVEIKWSAKAIRGRQVMEDLKRRASSCRALEGSELTYVVIARKGFSDRPRRTAGERFIDLGREKLAP